MATIAHETIGFSTFPARDGKPMADTEVNQEQMIILILALQRVVGPLGHHAGGNLLIYWNPENGLDHISPDVFVALDAGLERRESWMTRVEGKFPEVVMEIASPSTKNRHIGPKVDLYAARGAREYYIFDPAGHLNPSYGEPVPTPREDQEQLWRVLACADHVEQAWRVAAAQAAQAEQARREAEEQAVRDRRAREEAEAQTMQEQQAREEAEERAAREQRARMDAESRAAEARIRALEDAMARGHDGDQFTPGP